MPRSKNYYKARARARTPYKGKARPNTSVGMSRFPHSWVGFENPPRLLSTDSTCTVTQDIAGALATQAAGAAVFGAVAVQFVFLDQQATLAALFDEYRIDLLQVTFRPHANDNPMTAATTIVPQLITVIDLDDSTPPTTLASMREYDGTVISVFETQVRTLKPGMVTASGENRISPWLDMAVPNVPHFGVKWGVEAGAGAQTVFQVWSIQIRMQVTMRHVR
jgi:hypothetical protein